MSSERRVIKVTVDRGTGRESRPVTYEVPIEKGQSVLGVLDYIYERFDPGLTFYSSCRIGLCTGCLVRVNGKPVLACTTIAQDDMLIEPHDIKRRARDLVVQRGAEASAPEGEVKA